MIWKEFDQAEQSRAEPSRAGMLILMWLLVRVFLPGICFLPVELRMQIDKLSCLHADVWQMSSSQVRWRLSRAVAFAKCGISGRKILHRHANSTCQIDSPSDTWPRFERARLFHPLILFLSTVRFCECARVCVHEGEGEGTRGKSFSLNLGPNRICVFPLRRAAITSHFHHFLSLRSLQGDATDNY